MKITILIQNQPHQVNLKCVVRVLVSKANLDGMWKYDVVLNANGKGGNNLDTASLTWAAMKPFQIQFGRFKQAFNLEGLTSSNDIDFNERSFMNQISPHKKVRYCIQRHTN
jgi:phosphate-selective porin